MSQRIVYYEPDSRLMDFLPGHLRDARDAGITIVSADWDSNNGGAVVVTQGIDRNNPAHAKVGAQAADFQRSVMGEDEVPTEGLVPIDF